MEWVAVVSTTPEGRMAVYNAFATEAEAAAHADTVRAEYPEAFVAPNPGGHPPEWRWDGAALIVDPLPPVVMPPDAALELQELRARLDKLEKR